MSLLPIPFATWQTYAGHSGIDSGQPRGTLIPASGPGTVESAEWYNSRAGNGTVIAYDNGPRVLYCHFDNLDHTPRVGSRVGLRDTIGAVGSSGRATGPHAHFEIYGEFAAVWRYFDPNIDVSEVSVRTGELVVDGALGGYTIRDLQVDLGTDPDGVISEPYSHVVAELQRRLNGAGARDWDGNELKVDGNGLASNIGRKVGPYRTVFALQRHVGIGEPDGILDADDSLTVRRVQERLNAGSLF